MINTEHADPAHPTANPRAPNTMRLLFAPVSGPGGAGEYYRCLAIASAAIERWPHAQVRFVLSRHARYATSAPFPVVLLEDSPTRASGAVIAEIERFRPDVMVFDSAGRVQQLRAARRAGAAIVYISSRWKTRWKGFRLRRMILLDQHWIMTPQFLDGALNAWERLKLRVLRRPDIAYFPTMFDAPDEASACALLDSYGLREDAFVLACPGGAGDFGHGVDAPTVFLEAAKRIAAIGGVSVLMVGSAGASEAPNIFRHPPVPNATLMALLPRARLCLVNGGSLVLQAVAQHAACVAAPIAGDQAARIEACARRGCVRAAALTAESIAAEAQALLRDDAARSQLRARARALGLVNGASAAVDMLERLLLRR